MVEAGIEPRTFSPQIQALSAASLLHVSQTSEACLVSSSLEAGLFQRLQFSFFCSFKPCELLSAVARPGAGPKVPRSAPLRPWTHISWAGSRSCSACMPRDASSLCKLWCPRAVPQSAVYRAPHTPLSGPACHSRWPAKLLLCQLLSPAPSSPGKPNGSRTVQDSTASPAFANLLLPLPHTELPV